MKKQLTAIDEAFLEITVELSFGDITEEQAVEHIVRKTNCTKEEAIEYVKKFTNDAGR